MYFQIFEIRFCKFNSMQLNDFCQVSSERSLNIPDASTCVVHTVRLRLRFFYQNKRGCMTFSVRYNSDRNTKSLTAH